MMKKENDIAKNLEELIDEESFNIVVIKSFKCLFVKNNNYIYLLIAQLILLPIIYVIVQSDNTLNTVSSIVSILFGLIVALFGIFFTGYAIFQAFMSRKLTVALLENYGEKRGLFNEYNLFFFSMCVLYLLIILIDLMAIMYLENFENLKVMIPFNVPENSPVAFILINLIIALHMFALIEVKSLIFNIYQAFNSSAIIIGLDELDNQN